MDEARKCMNFNLPRVFCLCFIVYKFKFFESTIGTITSHHNKSFFHIKIPSNIWAVGRRGARARVVNKKPKLRTRNHQLQQ